jgi:hypothetical protein
MEGVKRIPENISAMHNRIAGAVRKLAVVCDYQLIIQVFKKQPSASSNTPA